MKNIAKLFVAALAIVGFSVDASAQQTSSASANTSATIIQPISITKTADLAFGNLAVSNANAGTVVLATGGGRTRTGGVSLPANTGTVTAAAFDVEGAAGYTYSITLPPSVELDDNANHTMLVNSFNSSATGTLDANGEESITVGATLNVSAAQAPGTYESDTDFNVVVNYN